MTVEENLWMGGYLAESPARARAAAEEVLAKYPRLAERRAQKAGTLSGGERRLLEISRALIMEPRLLLDGVGSGAYLSYAVESLGGGLYGFTFTVCGNDGIDSAFFAELTYEGYEQAQHAGQYGPGQEGLLQNARAFGVIDVHKEADAALYASAPEANYDSSLDSWLAFS